MSIPYYRPRRLRSNENIRRMVRETALSPADFIYPLVHDCEEVNSLGVPAVILFGIPEHKDELGCEAYDDRGIVQNAIRAIKERVPDLIVITDVCLCEYTGRGAGSRHPRDNESDHDRPIVSYAAKYASGFYGPCRAAAESTPQFGDRR